MAKKVLGIDDTDYTKSFELAIDIDENYVAQVNVDVNFNTGYLYENVIDCPTRINDWLRLGYTAFGAHDHGTSSSYNVDVTSNYNGFDTDVAYKWVILPRGTHEGQSIIIQHFHQVSTFAQALYIQAGGDYTDGWVSIELDNDAVTSKYARLFWINSQWRILYTNGVVAY